MVFVVVHVIRYKERIEISLKYINKLRVCRYNHLANLPKWWEIWESNPWIEVRLIMTVLCFYFSMYKKVQTLKQKQTITIIQSCCKRLPIQYPVDIAFIKNAQVSSVVCSVILKNFILKVLKFAGIYWFEQ